MQQPDECNCREPGAQDLIEIYSPKDHPTIPGRKIMARVWYCRKSCPIHSIVKDVTEPEISDIDVPAIIEPEPSPDAA